MNKTAVYYESVRTNEQKIREPLKNDSIAVGWAIAYILLEYDMYYNEASLKQSEETHCHYLHTNGFTQWLEMWK